MGANRTADQVLNLVLDETTGKLKFEGSIDVGDVEIGAVELKDGATDTRAKVGPASGSAVGDNVVEVGDPYTRARAAAAVNNPVAARTTDVAITGAAGRLHGFSLGEGAATPGTAKCFIRDGADATGAIVAVLDLNAAESSDRWFGDKGIAIATGVFLDMVSGTIEGAIYTGPA